MDKKPAKRRSKSADQRKKDLDNQLEEALEATFPASDPVAVGHETSTEPHRPVHRKPARIDKDLVEQLADEVAARDAGI